MRATPPTFEFPYAVTFAVEIPKEAALASLNKPSEEMRSAYKMCNKKLKAAGEKIVQMLAAEGYKARFIDPAQRVNPEKLLGPISQKAIASLSGMGWIGKNGLLITEEYGPRQRMGAVLTDMPVTHKAKLIDNKCGDCTACIDRCAMKVLKNTELQASPGVARPGHRLGQVRCVRGQAHRRRQQTGDGLRKVHLGLPVLEGQRVTGGSAPFFPCRSERSFRNTIIALSAMETAFQRIMGRSFRKIP